jgi:hypothetical protein
MSLPNLLIKFADNATIVRLITNVQSDPRNYENHNTLKKYLIKTENYKNAEFEAYYDEYHEFMYKKDFGVDKVWYKPGTDIKHCTKTFVNSDGLVETYPADIRDSGRKIWYIEGVCHRTDLDKFGNTLPTDISPCGLTFWEHHGKLHRLELGKNPDCKYYNRPMPAVIYSYGSCAWRNMGQWMSEAAICEVLRTSGSERSSDAFGTNVPQTSSSPIGRINF